jgi:hypothetical protein
VARDEPFHVAETLHDARRFLVINVQHQRQRQDRLVPVRRDQVDARQVLVVLVCFGLAGNPAQHEVHRRHQLDFQRVRVERVLAGRQRFAPHAALTGFDLFAVPEAGTGHVHAFAAVVRDDHADKTDRDERLWPELDRGEPAVDEERAVREYL